LPEKILLNPVAARASDYINKLWISMDVEESCHGLIQGLEELRKTT
jgi:hypothetical protein